MEKLTASQQEKIQHDREMDVYKRNDMIQKARFTLTVQEQRAVLYAISQIRPADTFLTEYVFEIKDFYRMIGWENQSYTEFKSLLRGLRDKSWWMLMPDGETESAVSWFAKVRTNQKSGKVTVKFDEDMMPYLVQLAEQGEFYTKYSLQYVLPMSCQYSPRLYEILKSYQKNNKSWFFDIEELKRLLDCQNYKNFYDVKRWVLEPAVEEINKYTDLKIAYREEKAGRGGRVVRVIFGMVEKSKQGLLEAKKAIREELDGQMNFSDVVENVKNDPIYQLFTESAKERRAEREEARKEGDSCDKE